MPSPPRLPKTDQRRIKIAERLLREKDPKDIALAMGVVIRTVSNVQKCLKAGESLRRRTTGRSPMRRPGRKKGAQRRPTAPGPTAQERLQKARGVLRQSSTSEIELLNSIDGSTIKEAVKDVLEARRGN